MQHDGAVRLFVAVRLPAAVLDLVRALPRPDRPGVRWTTEEQWHVTLRFLGNVDDGDAAVDALRSVRAAPCEAVLGPVVRRLGSGVVCVPVAGLGDVAAAVVEATAAVGDPPDARPFFGHLTLARLRRVKPRGLLGAPISASWPVTEVELIESRLHPDGARYRTVAVHPLGA